MVRRLFEGRPLFLSAMALCGVYSRAATNRGAAFIRVNTVYGIIIHVRSVFKEHHLVELLVLTDH